MNSDSSSSNPSSVTEWIAELKQGSDAAASKIWARYVEQLVRAADRRLRELPRRAIGAEDVAQEAFAGFFQGVREGRFSKLDDREDLWCLLAMLADRRAKDHLRRELAERRGGGYVRGDSVVHAPDDQLGSGPRGFDRLEGPQFAPETVDELIRLIQAAFPALTEAGLQEIALDRAANYSEREIAQRHNTSLRSVQRKLQLVRSMLEEASSTGEA